jgi:hypothetical protein
MGKLPVEVLFVVEHNEHVPGRGVAEETILVLFILLDEAVALEDVFGLGMVDLRQ